MYDPRDILELEFLLVSKLQEEWAKIAPAQFKPVADAIDDERWDDANEAATLIDAGGIGAAVKDFAYTVYRGMMDHGAMTAAGGRSLTSSLDFDDEVRSVVSQLVQHLEVSTTVAAQDRALQLIAQARTTDVQKIGNGNNQWQRNYGKSKPDEAAAAAEQAEYVKSLKLPPAWTNVWINPDRTAKLLATGYDKKGKKQPRYSKEHSKNAEAEKFGRLAALNKALPMIRKRLNDGLRDAPTDHLAVLSLIERTGIRIGSDSDLKAGGTAYGATTLLAKHVRIGADGTINLEFQGKSGKTNTREFRHKPLFDFLKTKLSAMAPEDSLFKTSDDAARNALGKIVKGFKPKDFRTWHGTNEALKELANHKVAVSDADMVKLKRAVSKKVSEFLNNTPKVALDAYINPAVFDQHTGDGYSVKKQELGDEDDQRMTEFLEGVVWDDLGDWESTPESEPADDDQPVQVAKANPLKGFTSFADAGNQSLQLIATLHASRLSNWGFIGEADMRGQTTYKLNAMLDNRTSEFCRMINGRTFTIDQARTLVDQSIYADDPQALRQIQPWPDQSKTGMSELKGLTNDQLAERGFHVPPFHPGCRTMMTRVDTPAPLGKAPAKEQVIPASVSTAESFDQLGVKVSGGQLKVWNDYVGMHPATVLQSLTGKTLPELLKGGWGLKITPAGNVKLDWAKNSLVLNPLTNSLAFKNSALADSSAYLKNSAQISGYAKSLGVQKITLRVDPGDAVDALASGFVPSPVEWQAIKSALKSKLEGALSSQYLGLSASQKVGLFTILGSNLESSILGLLDLPRPFLGLLVADLKYSGSLYL